MTFVMLLVASVFTAAPGSPVADSPNVKVLVLDALNGKPQAGVTVLYLCDEIPHSVTTQVTTDVAGFAVVPYTCKSGSKIELNAVPKIGKEGCGSGVDATLEEIMATGIVAHPDSAGGIWCPTRISRKLSPVPGQNHIVRQKADMAAVSHCRVDRLSDIAWRCLGFIIVPASTFFSTHDNSGSGR